MICAKDNPFTVRRIEALGYQPQEVSWETIEARLAALNFTAAITGPHGSGKTTLLEALEKRLSIQKPTQKLFTNEDCPLPWSAIRRALASLPESGILFFDGACHLGRWHWAWVKHYAARKRLGLVITSHEDGRLPTLLRCQPNPEILTTLVNRLLPDRPPTETTLITLFNTCGGNIRQCLRTLYDLYAMEQL